VPATATRFDPKLNKPALQSPQAPPAKPTCPTSFIQRVLQFARRASPTSSSRVRHRLAVRRLQLTVSGQNSNNSVRLTDDFLRAVRERRRLEPDPPHRRQGLAHPAARDLWDKIAYAAWACADPGLQFDTTINDWHTCPAGGRINASNPCSEYMFLDDTACNLASLNLLRFYDPIDGVSTSTALRARVPAVDADARDLGADGAVPQRRHRRALLRLPHARPRLRQYRRPADGAGHRYDSRRRRALAGASPRS
jgi:hypothetical protein